MLDKKRFEQDYKKMQNQNVPDLWNRIESELSDAPLRTTEIQEKKPLAFRRSWSYGLAVAASLVILVSGVRLTEGVRSKSSDHQSTLGMMDENAAAALETTLASMAEAAETAAAADNAGGNAMAEAADTALNNAGGGKTAANVLHIPDGARTVPVDSRYFSEDILQETELLAEVVIDSVSLGYQENGIADHVIYQGWIREIHYAAGYITEHELTITSPIVQSDADEAYLLYQMKPEQSYLLPLKAQDGNWELIYPFAPQIEVAADQGYIFHSGYSSLVNQDTVIAKREQEGSGDYYYDRMLSRDDDNFLSDFVSLVEYEVQGRD